MLNQPAISPPGECASNIDMFRRLAKTMGFNDDYWSMSDDELLMKMYNSNAPAMKDITLDKLKEVGWMRLNVGAPGERAPHAEGNFKTPSGKCEFKAAPPQMATSSCPSGATATMRCSLAIRSTPCQTTFRLLRSLTRSVAKRYPISLISPKPHAFSTPNTPTYRSSSGAWANRSSSFIRVMQPAQRQGWRLRAGVRRIAARRRQGRVEHHVQEGLAAANLGYWPSLTVAALQ